MAQPIIHVQFSAQDPLELASWYSRLFGWTVHNVPEMNYATAEWSTDPSAVSAGFYPPAAGALPGHTIVYIYSDDIDADVERVTSAGGDVFRPRSDIPGAGSIAFLKDPSGNIVALWHTAAQP
jgi:hypothetical protein